jgi:dTDP-3,4-didehydro-2,6-dideoxy-alpha-D-glucose 3-reductase
MTSGDRIGIGVLGIADIAVRRTIPAIQRCDRLALVAVASRDPVKAASAGRRFGCAGVVGYERLLARDDVQAVYIPLPNSMHVTWTYAALRAGKHVLVEKSLTADAAAAAQLAEAARGLALVENFTFLHHAQHDVVRTLVADGAIGTPRSFNAAFGIPSADAGLIRYRRDLEGGSLRENGCYPIRAAQLYLGADIQVRGAHLRLDPTLGVDVAGSVLMVDGDGMSAHCEFGLDLGYRNTYSIWGSAGRIELDWAFTPPADRPTTLRLYGNSTRGERTLPPCDQFLAAVTAFAAACGDPAGRAGPAADAVRQAGLLESIWRSVRVDA